MSFQGIQFSIREEQVVSLNVPLGAALIPARAFTGLAYGSPPLASYGRTRRD